jgi:hypothetical protein
MLISGYPGLNIMANDDGRLLLAAIIGFGGGIYTFLKGFREYRRYRLVADTPEIRIRSAPMGFVQVRGRACGAETLLSPVTRTPCYLFKVVVEQWHTESEGGGEWKHLTTDIQNVKFDLQDASGNVLVDPANADLDLPSGPIRKLGSTASAPSIAPSPPKQGVAALSGRHATDSELLQYIERARLRHFTQMVGKGVGLVSRAIDPASAPQRPSILSLLADPTGSGAGDFAGQMMRGMLARRDPSGETTRAALEVWKYPPGSPVFAAALARAGQVYARVVASGKTAPDRSGVEAQIRQNPEMAMTMSASIAGAAEPQADQELEKARQCALAYAREHAAGLIRQRSPAATGHFRLTEYCLLPGQMYNITGTCAENPHPRNEDDRNIILKGAHESTFLISSKAEKEVESWLGKRALWMVLGGAALAIVCLAIVLGITGLL